MNEKESDSVELSTDASRPSL